jgi:predicted amidohydrolase
MKIAIAQLNFHIGNFEGNLQKMMSAVAQAKSKSADIVVFGELATCGYPPRDSLNSGIYPAGEESIEQLKTFGGIGIIVGSPTINPRKGRTSQQRLFPVQRKDFPFSKRCCQPMMYLMVPVFWAGKK